MSVHIDNFPSTSGRGPGHRAASGCWEELRGSLCPGDIFGDPSVPAAGKRARGSDLHCEGRDLRAPGLSPGEKEAER